jgi:hypothetical protein
MRRTDRAVRRGTSLQGSDRTAGDSSPVTQEKGRRRGRPGPVGGTTHVRIKSGPNGCGGRVRPARRAQSRGRPKSPCTQLHRPVRPAPEGPLAEARTTKAGRPTQPPRRRDPPAPLPRHRCCPDAGADEKKGPAAAPRGALRMLSGRKRPPTSIACRWAGAAQDDKSRTVQLSRQLTKSCEPPSSI